MPRTVRDANLETRSARARLEAQCFHWRAIAPGLALGYWHGKRGFGSWTLRTLTDRASGRYSTQRFAYADDTRDADGVGILTYHQAAERARALSCSAADASPGEPCGPFTVESAAREYLEWFAAHRKSAYATKNVIDAHIRPRLGRRLVAELTTREIQRWHESIAASRARLRRPRDEHAPRHREQDLADPAVARRRRASANRILSVLRAILNHAWREGRAPSDSAWRRVRPFKNASEPLVRYLSEEEARRLVNTSPPDLRALVRAAMLTGCRYGELVALRVEDYRADAGTVHVRESKSGAPRHVPLTDEGLALFDALCAGRAGAELAFLRAGRPWGKNHQVRELAAACKRSGIVPQVSFHVLRHTYGSWLAMRGVALQVIAAALGHSDTRITHKHYAHLAPSHIAEVIRAHLPEIASTGAKVRALRARRPKAAAQAT